MCIRDSGDGALVRNRVVRAPEDDVVTNRPEEEDGSLRAVSLEALPASRRRVSRWINGWRPRELAAERQQEARLSATRWPNDEREGAGGEPRYPHPHCNCVMDLPETVSLCHATYWKMRGFLEGLANEDAYRARGRQWMTSKMMGHQMQRCMEDSDSDEEETTMPRLTGSVGRARNVYRNTSKKSSKVAMMRGMSARRPSAPQPTSRAPASFTLLGLVV